MRPVACRRVKPTHFVVVLVLTVALRGPVRSAFADEPKLPEGPGLAAQYPGDRGIEHDAHVLFVEDFGEGDLAAVGKRWSDVSNQDGKVFAFTADVPKGSTSRRSLLMTATLGKNYGGHLYRLLSHGEDLLYARFYVKFAEDTGYIHHFVTLGGYNPPTKYPQGGAGERPQGDDRITVGIEPYGDYGKYPAPGSWNFYTYWPEMKRSGDGRYWGNSITPAQPAPVPRNRWQCVEIMVKLNSAPDKADGDLALWLDGKLTMHVAPGVRRGKWDGLGFSLTDAGGTPFEGFRWRTGSDLKLNFFWLMHYVTENAPRQNNVANPNPINRVWFANVVVGTRYIGPLKP